MSLIISQDEWFAWEKSRAKARVLELQRERRHRLRRIDYYPSDEAARIIDELSRKGVRLDGHFRRHDNSSVISRIIETWNAKLRKSPTGTLTRVAGKRMLDRAKQ